AIAGSRMSSASEGIVYSSPVSTMIGPRTSRYRQAMRPSGIESATPITSAMRLCRRCTAASSTMSPTFSMIQFMSRAALREHALRAPGRVDDDGAVRGALEPQLALPVICADEGRHEVVGGVRDDLARSALLHDAGTGVEDDDA